MSEEKPPCPYCNAPYGYAGEEFLYGCTNSSCPEQPMIHDPVGDTSMKNEFWKDVIRNAPEVKRIKRRELGKLELIVKKYYHD